MTRTVARILPGLAVAAAVATTALACGGGSSAAPTTPTTGTTTPVAPTSAAGCELVGTSSTSPAVSLLTSAIAIGTSADGVTVSNLSEVLTSAAVPDGVQLADGSVNVYYINANTNGLSVARLSGGALVPVSAVTIDGVASPTGVVDPDVMLINGKIRMAYLNSRAGTRSVCVAESTDGVTFHSTGVGWAFGAVLTATDPTEVRLADGSWLMGVADTGATRLARSSTGLGFTASGSVAGTGGVAELAMTNDGRVRLYACVDGITSYISSDNGATFTREGNVIPHGTLGRSIACDPSYVAGAGLFVFKTQ